MNVQAKTDTFNFPALNLNRGDYIYFLREAGTMMGGALESGPFLTIKKVN